MVQEEVADRLAASAGTSAYGVLSATAQMHGRVEKLFALPPEAFTPAPGVSSAVVRFNMNPRFEDLHATRKPFMRFLQTCFHQKRKTLVNNLKSAAVADPAVIVAAIDAAGLNRDVRAEAVSLEAMASIFRQLYAE